jgi:tape measure domain-containing protein
MATQAKTQLQIAVKATGVAGLSKLKSALQSVNNIAKQSSVNFNKIGAELNKTNQTMVRSVNNVTKLKTSYEELARSVKFGSQQFKDATAQAKKLDKELAKMEKRRPGGGGLRGAAQTAGTVAGAGVFGGPEGAAGALIGAGVGGPAGAIVGGAIGAQVGQLRQALGATAEYAAELSKLRIALEGVSATQREYQRGLKFITQSTKDFAIPQSILTKQFTKLQASVSGAGGTVKDTEVAFKGIVAAVRATGGSLQDVDSALTATAQVFSKGKVSAEELRQQIGERLPGAFTLFAESMGKTPAELDKALEKGEVRLEDFMKFAEDLFKRYGETAQEIADGPDAAGDRLKVVLEELNEETGKLLKPMGASFQQFSEDVARFLTKVVSKVNETIRAVQEFSRQRYKREIIQYGRDSFAGQYAANMLAVLEEEMGLTGGFIGPQVPDRLLQTDFKGAKDEEEPEAKASRRGRGRQDISFALRQARIAVIQEENAERRLALQFEAKLLEIAESQSLENERAVKLQQALKDLSDGRAKIEEKRARDEAKRAKELKAFYDSFKIKTGEFDMNAKAEGPKTPFDMLRQGADEFTDSLKGALGAAKELATVGLQGISDGITNLVVNGTLNFREFAASLLRDMARIIMQQVVMKSLMQAIGFGGGGVDASQFQLANPRQFDVSMLGAPKFAKGGITRGVSIAGEAGPEAIVPLPDGRTIPVKMQGEGAKVIVNVDAQGTAVQGDTAGANRLGEAIGTAVRQELLKQKRPGGLLA